MTERDIFLAAHLYLQAVTTLISRDDATSHIHLSKLHLIMPTVTSTVSSSTFRFLLFTSLSWNLLWSCLSDEGVSVSCMRIGTRPSRTYDDSISLNNWCSLLCCLTGHSFDPWTILCVASSSSCDCVGFFLPVQKQTCTQGKWELKFDKICFPLCVNMQWTGDYHPVFTVIPSSRKLPWGIK